MALKRSSSNLVTNVVNGGGSVRFGLSPEADGAVALEIADDAGHSSQRAGAGGVVKAMVSLPV
ncbi:MAG: hypothetical protein EXR05_04395 [Acetobacteraceae bacterium]|nr:hypothetical protein [Acetobacteraceae bacterium]